jgi:hypothetical protein
MLCTHYACQCFRAAELRAIGQTTEALAILQHNQPVTCRRGAGRIVLSGDVQGIRWERPVKLQRWTGWAWVDVGRYPSADHARAAAKRRGIKLKEKP